MVDLARVEDVIPANAELVLTSAERQAILEIAYLAIAWDTKLELEELSAFRIIAARLRDLVGDPEEGPMSRRPVPSSENRALTEAELQTMLDKFAAGVAREDADARLLALGALVQRPVARALAYEVAYTLSLCDADAGDGEFEFELQLIDALDLDGAEAETLAKKARATLGV